MTQACFGSAVHLKTNRPGCTGTDCGASSTLMNSTRLLPRPCLLTAVALMVLMLVVLIGWHWSRTEAEEPLYGGKRLSEWLYPTLPDFVWIPNDVYGHIHNELWERLVDPSEPARFPVTGWGIDPSTRQPLHLDTNAIPWLIRWMGARPSPWERLRHQIADHLPARLGTWIDSSARTVAMARHYRWQVAAFEGFTSLSTNATAALPALSNLLFRADATMPLTFAIGNIGPEGLGLLTNVLTRAKAPLRDDAALSLGLHYAEATMALPALVRCVERGEASYQVLGAIGRIGGENSRLVPALVTWLNATNTPPGVEFDEDMAILVLGLQGPRARAALPALRSRYLQASAAGDQNDCKLLRRVLKKIAPNEDLLPPPGPGEDSTEWP
jgi:hypothetical protein